MRRNEAVSGVLADRRPWIGPWNPLLMSYPLLRDDRPAPPQDSQPAVSMESVVNGSDLAAVEAPDGERDDQHHPARRPAEVGDRGRRLDEEGIAGAFGGRAENVAIQDRLELIDGSAPERIGRQQELTDGSGILDPDTAEHLTDRAGDTADPGEKKEHQADDAGRHPRQSGADQQRERHDHDSDRKSVV